MSAIKARPRSPPTSGYRDSGTDGRIPADGFAPFVSTWSPGSGTRGAEHTSGRLPRQISRNSKARVPAPAGNRDQKERRYWDDFRTATPSLNRRTSRNQNRRIAIQPRVKLTPSDKQQARRVCKHCHSQNEHNWPADDVDKPCRCVWPDRRSQSSARPPQECTC